MRQQPDTTNQGHKPKAERVTLQVRVKPGARASQLIEQTDGTWLAQVKAMPVDGKANAELIELMARHHGVARSHVVIKSGAGGRHKWVQILN